ncbi:hypothetical protein O181_036067, partial [Austropuccinia psidii MF-1]|nr:hypothetical protein [Austropuccinia psidii MF-1]
MTGVAISTSSFWTNFLITPSSRSSLIWISRASFDLGLAAYEVPLKSGGQDSSPPDHPATVQWLVKITQDPPVCTHTHHRGPSAGLDVGGRFEFTRSSMKGLRLSGILILQMTLVEPATQYGGSSSAGGGDMVRARCTMP